MAGNAEQSQSGLPGDVSWGLWLIVVGGLFLASTATIKDSVAQGNGDPGPRAVPMVVSLLLIGGGLVSVAIGLRQRAQQSRPTADTSNAAGDRRVIYFAAATCCYIACVSFGFYVSTFAFASLANWKLGAPWWASLLAGGVITGVVWGLFAKLFLVPLPSLLEAFFGM